MKNSKKDSFSPTLKYNKINSLDVENEVLVPAKIQSELFLVEKQIEFDGVEMGVLANGVPYLTESGLARMCGIDRKALNRLAINWAEEKYKPRGKIINQLLEQSEFYGLTIFLKSTHNGTQVNAFTEPVCLALLEYYAFLADEPREQALMAFRTLAKTKFREFIYNAVGYAPEVANLDSWKHFHDRVAITSNSVPLGYFGIFTEIASIIVPMINAGIIVNDKLIPDISVGRAWSSYWEHQRMSEKHGDRIKYDHEYPDYYPQSKSNPQPSYAYPDNALGDFRKWLRENYLKTKLPSYLLGQITRKRLTKEIADKTIETLVPKALPQT